MRTVYCSSMEPLSHAPPSPAPRPSALLICRALASCSINLLRRALPSVLLFRHVHPTCSTVAHLHHATRWCTAHATSVVLVTTSLCAGNQHSTKAVWCQSRV